MTRNRFATVGILAAAVSLVLAGFAAPSHAHAVAEGDKGYIQEISGVHQPQGNGRTTRTGALHSLQLRPLSRYERKLRHCEKGISDDQGGDDDQFDDQHGHSQDAHLLRPIDSS